MVRCFRCGAEGLSELFDCQVRNCSKKVVAIEGNNEGFLCSLHKNIISRLENDLDDFKAEIERQRISFKKEIKALQEDRTRLITERDDKVYLVKEKLTHWIKLLKKEPKPSK